MTDRVRVSGLVLLVGVLAALALQVSTANAAEPPDTAGLSDKNRHQQTVDRNWRLLDRYCSDCHNAVDWAGGVAFDTMNPHDVAKDAEVWEEAVRKLRGRMMPPPGKPHPSRAEIESLAGALETSMDTAARENPNPGSVQLHRFNRTEYARAVEDLLDMRIDAPALLPRDDSSSGFDNVAAVLKISPSFLEQYLGAARQVSVQAVGNPAATAEARIYAAPPEAGQYMHLDGLPLGTRGGMQIEYRFPADGEYTFTITGLVGAGYVWGVQDENTLIVTIDDAQVFEGRFGGEEDLNAVDLEQAVAVTRINDRFRDIRATVKAGPHKIGVTFIARSAAEQDYTLHTWVPVTGMSVFQNSASTAPRMQNLEITGPFKVQGVSDTPSRRRIFTCRPARPTEEMACAESILARLARQAFRRPLNATDLTGPMAFFREGQAEGGFESGIQKGLMAILASPKFLYRAHPAPPDAKPGSNFALGERELASRLAFFLWSGPPDEQLLQLAEKGELRGRGVLDAQVRRMLADERAGSLVNNFAFQWLHVEGLDQVNPDPGIFPQYTADLVPAFERELELFIGSVFGTDRSVVDLLTANHTFLNERLALHYGISGVRGGQFREVTLQQSFRKGLLGKGAFLMATSYANRTTPVLRGAYILEKFMGTPPTAPPADVEAFPETQEGAVPLTVRARLEMHRQVKSCNSCHGLIDPLGLALENFNSLGQWRKKDVDAGEAIDATGKLVDGTPLRGPDDLRQALVSNPRQFAQTFIENLMTFALGRGIAYYDMPAVRTILRNAAADDYRFSSIVRGIVNSPAFQMERVPDQTEGGAVTKTARLQMPDRPAEQE